MCHDVSALPALIKPLLAEHRQCGLPANREADCAGHIRLRGDGSLQGKSEAEVSKYLRAKVEARHASIYLPMLLRIRASGKQRESCHGCRGDGSANHLTFLLLPFSPYSCEGLRRKRSRRSAVLLVSVYPHVTFTRG